MLKKRVVASVIVRNGIVVQSVGFERYLPVGRPDIAIEFLNSWGIDEIILLDISASKSNYRPDANMVKKASKKCYVPLTVGGGIKNIEHITELMHCGADKISLNQAAINNRSLITDAAHIFGDQCVVVSIDAVKTSQGYKIYDYINKKSLDLIPSDFARELQERGAGEILINSVDRDGSYAGYDLQLIDDVCSKVSIPVTSAGGAKNAYDMITVFEKTAVSAASAANFFHFTEHSVNTTKAVINKKLKIRLETFADYKDNLFDNNLRLVKKTDKDLEDLLYIKIEKEII